MDILESGQMTPEEERAHWWIRTRFEYLGRGVDTAAERFGQLRVLEVGCGTAQNLRYLRQHPDRARKVRDLVGVEPALPETGGSESGRDAGDARLLRSFGQLDPGERFEILVAMDVLEHIDDDAAALRAWAERLVPGGYAFLTVPAFDWLWSDHDEALQHKRRYTRASLLAVARAAGLRPVRSAYAFSLLLPAFYVVRRMIPRPARESGTDLRKTHPVLNAALTAVGKAESKLGGNPLFGTSVVGLFEK
jgi:2-polyprenyl-3-methyl-5-hydroxy-6-metoxy-1,4-benzoquinol methylase